MRASSLAVTEDKATHSNNDELDLLPPTFLFPLLHQLFSLLFICLVMYLDLLCWTVFTGPWLFLGASSCVWLELMRNTGGAVSPWLLSVLHYANA